MSNLARRLGAISAVMVGVIVGGVATLSADRIIPGPREPIERSVVASPTPTIRPTPPTPRGPTAVLAWAPGGAGTEAERALRRTRGVGQVTEVAAGIERLVATHEGDGGLVEEVPAGWFVPLDTAAVDPAAYASFVAPSERRAVSSLKKGDVLLSETSADLRAVGVGAELSLEGGRRLVVTGIISDRSAGGYEAVVARPWKFDRTYPFLLAMIASPAVEDRVAANLRKALPGGTPVRVRTLEETPYLRYGDAVLPQMIIKRSFGEFALRPSGDGFDVGGRWRDRNIVTAEIPVLGSVLCHRAVIPQLQAALSEIETRGVAQAIDPGDYGGCFSPRFIGGAASGRLSHHSWGIAVDIDVSENAFGTKADQDPRVVDIFERHGFTWGGRWLVPDGMHFEWVRFP